MSISGGGLTGFPCPKCGRYVGSNQVHDCFNWSTCGLCGAKVGMYQVHYCSKKPLPNIPKPWGEYPPWIPKRVPIREPVTYPQDFLGYWCGRCGTYVPDGTSHTCIGKFPIEEQPQTKRPFTCPKCNGEKKVNGKKCVPCAGTGIVWG
jgi:DNA-directed RNA polymerase subunit RPC12/RpoP